MVIIVEGPDGSGKTTLCNKLNEQGFTIIRRVRSDTNFSFTEFVNMQHSNTTYVMDRAMLTPWAYRLLDEQALDHDDFTLLEVITLLSKSKLIYCTCKRSYDYSILRGEDNITDRLTSMRLRTIYDFIVDTLKLYNISTIYEYDFEKQSFDDVIKFIKEA